MFLRVSPEDIIVYANTALANYLGIAKENLIGMRFEDLQRGIRAELQDCFARPERGEPMHQLVADENGRVFETRVKSERGVLDIVLCEVTHSDATFGDLLRSTGISLESLTEEEIRILRQADRRVATVSVTRMQDFSATIEKLPPHEAQLMLDAFAEETSEAILATGSTVGQMAGRSVTGIFGSPRYHRDHAVRAVLSACLQIDRLERLYEAFSKQGRELPGSSISIATGEMLLAVVETGARRVCNSVGETVELAEILARLARPGEVVLTEETLKSILANLPTGWESIRCETESEADLSGFDWTTGQIEPPAELNRKVAWLLGPGVTTDTSKTELYIDYIFSLVDREAGTSNPILRVVRPLSSSSAIDLDERNVVTDTVATYMGKYRLMEIVGEGGMGKVWRGEDRFGNSVAIKVLNSSDSATAAQLQRFKREAEIMARLPHRNICRVFEFGEFEKVNFIAMEFVDGVTLSDLLYIGDTANRSSTPLPELIHTIRSLRDIAAVTTTDQAPSTPSASRILPPEQSIAIINKVCGAVQFAHEHGVLHRDLKPGNILLREDAEPLVADFGLAKVDSAGESLSVSDHVVGTVENMAPEQARSSKNVDCRADVFSIGTILYQLLTGRKFFTATGNLVADAHALQHYEAPRPRALNKSIDPDLEVIVMKALRSEPNARYSTVAALQADLEHFLRGEPISARPVTAGELIKKLALRNKPVTAVTAASIVIFIAGLAVAAWTINDRRVEAEDARRLAESARHEAEERRAEAEAARQLADQRRTDAETALAEAERARVAEREARGLHDEAVARAEQSDEQRARALEEQQRLSQLADEQARRLQETEQSLEELREQSRSDAQSNDLAATAEELNAIFQLGFTPAALEQMEDRDALFERTNRMMDQVTALLMKDPQLTPALTLKARLHLAALEIPSARATVGRALEAAKSNPDLPGADDAQGLASVLARVRSSVGISTSGILTRLRESGRPLDGTTANLLHALESATPASQRGSGSFGRPITTGEIVFSVHANNPNIAGVEVEQLESGSLGIAIDAAGSSVDLSPLRGLDITSLQIRNAKSIDLRSLHTLPLEDLDLRQSAVSTLGLNPQTQTRFRIRKLDLSDTDFVDSRELALLPLLENLDISNSDVRSLDSLTGRKIRRLNIAGCPLDSLNALYWMPLERLTLTPEMATAMKSMARFRSHRTLRYIRTPDDPEDQTSAVFWRALDAGAYDTDAGESTKDESPSRAVADEQTNSEQEAPQSPMR